LRILILIKLLVVSSVIYSQEVAKPAPAKKPIASPEAFFTQQFGQSQITVSYARPMVRGRKIFGNLVPFDSLWRTGASDCTVITLKEDVIIGGKKIRMGKYTLFSIPTASTWTIILNTDTSLHGAFGYDETKDVHRFVVNAAKSDRFYETFTIEINDFTQKGDASLNLAWENTMVKIPLVSPHFEGN
jgi:hypothetical protein